MKNLNDLREIQARIQAAVQDQNSKAILSDVLIEKPPITLDQRLWIYQGGYEARLEESLKDDFDRVLELMDSEEDFENLIREFIAKNPSTIRNIAEYSELFPEFVKVNHAPLYEAALSDWISLVAYKMPDPEPAVLLSMEDLQNEVPFKLRNFHSTILFKSKDHFYHTLKVNEEIEVQKISELDFKILNFLIKAQSIEELSEYCQKLEVSEEQMALKINEWITQQIIYCERV